MPVPLPVKIVMGALPLGFKGNLQELANAIGDAITATVDDNFLVGQIGGSPPTSNVGPWNPQGTDEWWFWNSSLGYYQPSEQGTPIGTIIMWGGDANHPPDVNSWLLCDGRAVNKSVYFRLYQAILDTWRDPNNTDSGSFNLPPGGHIYMNAPGTVFATQVPLDSGYTATQGVNARGGQQTHKLVTSDVPALTVNIGSFGGKWQSGGGGDWLLTPPWAYNGAPAEQTWHAPVVDANGTATGGTNQTTFSNMPPTVLVNFYIKYQ